MTLGTFWLRERDKWRYRSPFTEGGLDNPFEAGMGFSALAGGQLIGWGQGVRGLYRYSRGLRMPSLRGHGQVTIATDTIPPGLHIARCALVVIEFPAPGAKSN